MPIGLTTAEVVERLARSIAVWVGMIALLGVAAETASMMVVYLDEAWAAGRKAGTLTAVDQLVAISWKRAPSAFGRCS